MSDELSDRAKGWAKRNSDKADSSERADPSESSARSEPSDSSVPSELEKDRGSSEKADNSVNSAETESSDSSENSVSSEPNENVRNPDNVKEAWDGNYYYIPPDISSELDEEMARLQYECRDLKIKKNRHFNVVMVVDGLEEIQDMSSDEFKDRLDELGLL